MIQAQATAISRTSQGADFALYYNFSADIFDNGSACRTRDDPANDLLRDFMYLTTGRVGIQITNLPVGTFVFTGYGLDRTVNRNNGASLNVIQTATNAAQADAQSPTVIEAWGDTDNQQITFTTSDTSEVVFIYLERDSSVPAVGALLNGFDLAVADTFTCSNGVWRSSALPVEMTE